MCKSSITTVYYEIKRTIVLHRSAVQLGKIVTVFSRCTLQAAQEMFLHLLEHFSEYQLSLDLQIQKDIKEDAELTSSAGNAGNIKVKSLLSVRPEKL